MSTSIVCGVDDSPDSQAALRIAASLADRLRLKLVVAHVAQPDHIPYAAAAPFGRVSGPAAVVTDCHAVKYWMRCCAQTLSDLTNPPELVAIQIAPIFFGAYFPAALVVVVFVALAVVSDSLWAHAAGSAASRLRSSKRFLAVRRYVSGSVFVGLGAVTALAKRH